MAAALRAAARCYRRRMTTDDVRTIERDELHRKVVEHDDFKLVMSLSAWDFERKHIPGSIHFDTPEAMVSSLTKSDEIVVYCTNLACKFSREAYHLLVDSGFTNVRRYAAGIADWEEAGFPVEGTWTKGA